MLSLMRKHAGTWLIKLILGAIVVVFSFWGVGSYTERKLNRVAEVNGEIITVAEYNRAHRTLREQMRQRFGNSLNEDLLKVMQLEKQAVNQLVDERIMTQEAARLGFSVSDEELAAAITSFPAFQSNGRFDRRRYENLLAGSRLTVEQFELLQRNLMLTNKLRNLITSNARVDASEVLDWYNWSNATVSIDYIAFDSAGYEDLMPSEEAVAKHYEENRDSFKTEQRVKVRYLAFIPESYTGQVSLLPDAAEEYYDNNRKNWEQEQTIEARHILIRVDAGADEKTVAAAREKIDAIAARAAAGEDFTELAKSTSEGPSKDKGGYLGTFPRGAMVKPFEEAAFALAAGQVSQPVRTDFGWHLIKVEAVNPAGVSPFEQVRAEIEQQLTRSESRSLALEEAETVYDAVFEPEDFAAAAADRKLTVKKAEFTRSGPADLTSEPGKLATAAFALEEGDMSEVVELSDGFFLLYVEQKIPGVIPDLAAVRSKIQETLKRQLQEEKAAADCEAFLASVRDKENFEAAADDAGRELKTSGFFPRRGPIPDLGSENALLAAAFELTQAGQVAEKGVKGSGGWFAIRLAERKLPDESGLKEQEEGIRQQLQDRKRSTLFSEWLAKAKEASEIIIEPEYLGESD